MREIDTEAQVVWPAWCYSGNSDDSTLNVIGRKGEIDSAILPEIESSTETAAVATAAAEVLVDNKSKFNHCNRGKSKNFNLKRQKQTTTTKDLSAAFTEAVKGEISHFQQGIVQSLPPSFALNKFLSSDKMLSDRMLIGFNVVDNNKKHCDNQTTNLLLDKVKNEVQMDTTKNGELGNNNNNNNNNNNSVNNSSNTNNNNNNNNNNSIKRERLSPTTNGDVQSSISRSRSATPSSFPGTPPQPANPSESLSQNIPASLLSSVQARSNEFQTRNYSDFMRSLAAKYNNPNDIGTQRSMLFDTSKFASSKLPSKESPSPPDIKRPNLPHLTPPQVSSNPFVSSLLSSLPFSPAVFPPLIDMSSTQALVTLARAAKEAEIQNILRTAQKRPTTMSSTSPSTNRTSLTPTPQQQPPTQFSPQPFILPTQFHQSAAQIQQPRQSSSPMSSSSVPQSDFATASPLDLSSTPQTKRIKIEKTARSRSSSPTHDPLTTGKLAKTESGGAATAAGMQITETSRALTATPISRQCQAQSDEINSWTVDDVGEFVGSIDICAEYVKNFREQCIDGSGLPLLTEEHLTNSLSMKLGPALKLRSILAKKLGGPCPCVSCTTLSHQSHINSASVVVASVPSSSSSSSSSSSLGNLNQASSTASVHHHHHQLSCSSGGNIPRPASSDSGS